MTVDFKYHSRPGEVKKGIRASVSAKYEDGKLKIAVSRCSKKDVFTKRIGGVIADGRLSHKRYYTQVPLGHCDIKIFLHVAREVIKGLAKDSVVVRPDKISMISLPKEEEKQTAPVGA